MRLLHITTKMQRNTLIIQLMFQCRSYMTSLRRIYNPAIRFWTLAVEEGEILGIFYQKDMMWFLWMNRRKCAVWLKNI